MALSILDSLPFARLGGGDHVAHALATRALKLVCTAPEMTGLWSLAAQEGLTNPLVSGNTIPGLLDVEARRQLVAEIEAIVAIHYQLTSEEIAYILETFPIVKRHDQEKFGEYLTKRLVVECYHAMVATDAIGTT